MTANAESSAEPETNTEFVSRPYLKDGVLEDREYQTQLVEAGYEESTLVALPTGTGKTPIAARIAARRLDEIGGKVLMLAPTQPLVQQHADAFRDWLTIPEHEITVFTGDVGPDERAEQWETATSIVLATPQCIENDLVGNRYTLEDVSYCVFDECHRATGDYAYKYIAERYNGNAQHPLVTGLSASPGSSKDAILNVATNLGLTNIEVITEDNASLKQYLHDVDVTYSRVDLPDEIAKARDFIQEIFKENLEALKKKFGVLDSARKDITFRELQTARGKIQRLIDNDDSDGYSAMSVHAQAMKLYHALTTVETQGVEATLSYFANIADDAENGESRAAERIADDYRFEQAREILEDYDDIHPKLRELRMEVARTLVNDGQALIFTESRDNANNIVDFLDDHGKMDPVRFVGQNDKEGDPGMTQPEQIEARNAFENGEYNVMVATSVAEEGIDIPSVDLVLFYEPVPSGIRSIQRRGRTGRRADGRVVVLIAEDTQDEARYWVSQNRQDKMEEEMRKLKDMQRDLIDELRDEQAALSDFGERAHDTDQPLVVADTRETRSNVVKTLDRKRGVTTQLETLDVADYVVSDRVAGERKEHDDFISSITGDRDIFEQIQDLVNNYSRPFLILEGEDGIEGLYGRAQVDEKAIDAMLTSIAIDWGVSIIPTETDEKTADLLALMAEREQEDNDREVQLHQDKATESLDDQQEYVISSLADVGPVLARNLLSELGSPRAVLTASKEELLDVDKVGERTAERIRRVIDSEYASET